MVSLDTQALLRIRKEEFRKIVVRNQSVYSKKVVFSIPPIFMFVQKVTGQFQSWLAWC